MRHKQILAGFIGAVVFHLVILAPLVFGDYVLAFHGAKGTCAPCTAMVPVEAKLKAAGYDIRTVEAPARKDLFDFYRVRKWPQYAYVIERGGNSYDSGKRLVGLQTVDSLRSFCFMPAATQAGVKAAKAARSFFGIP